MPEKEAESEIQNFLLESRRKLESTLSCKTNAVPKAANGYPPAAFPIEGKWGRCEGNMGD